nr:hypothetical protein [Rhodococcus sp. AW25M09]
MPTPTVPFALSRRGLFRLAGAAALCAATASTVVACGHDELSGPALDSLTAQSSAARSDAADAAAAATVIPDYATALEVVAAQRTEHADALDTEIARATGATDASSTETSSVGTTTSAAPAPPPPDIAAVREALTASARSAANAARNESGYRAGLLGSISASCTVSALVVLA